MKRFFNYISIALLTITLFSCNKNEWTPEKEADFKKQFKETLLTKGNNMFSQEQAEYVTNCVYDKIKSQNLKPNDANKPGVQIAVRQMGKDCAQESFSKTKAIIDNTWNSETEKQYKSILKLTFIKSGVTGEKAEFLADCAITKLKEQKIGPADLQDSKNKDLVKKIGFACGQEMLKKK